MKFALIASVVGAAYGEVVPGIVEPSAHMCIEAMNFGKIMFESFGNVSSFEHTEFDRDALWGQGPIPGQATPFPDMSVRTLFMPTEVVDFTVDRVPALKKSILKRTTVFQTIKEVMDQQQELYHNYNLNFDNSILFVPEWMEYFKDNQKVVLEKFPGAISVAANIFHVPKGKVPFGVHNSEHASTANLRPSWPYWQRLANYETNQHVSFHTAIEDQLTIEDQPLVIYDKSPPFVSNIGYMVRAVRNSPIVDQTKIDVALSALASGQTPYMQPASNYITCQYLAHTYCPSSNELGDAVWWPLKAGQALFFDNFVFHGASTLGKAKKDRFTVDMRVTNYRLNSCNSSVYYHQNPVVSAMFRRSKDCISKIFGYESYKHLLTVMYDEHVAEQCAHTPMFYFAVNPVNLDDGFVDGHLYITPKAIQNHVKFAAAYFGNDDFTMPDEAKQCISAEVNA